MKSNVKKFASVLLAVAMLFSMCAVVSVSAADAGEAVGASLKVNVSSNYCDSEASYTVSEGNSVSVVFKAPEDLNIVNVQWGMNYDKAKLELTGVTAFTNDMLVNPNSTSYSVMGSTSNNGEPYQITEGSTMITFKFKALASGETDVFLKMVDLMRRTENGDSIVVENGTVNLSNDLKVVAASNFFAGSSKTFESVENYADASGNIFVTVSYKLKANNMYLVNLDIDELTYDPTVLEWKEEYNTYGTGSSAVIDFFPFAAEEGLGAGTVHQTANGRIVGNYSSVNPAAFAFNEDGSAITAVKATFKVIKPDAGSTTVTCNADVVTYCDTSEERPYMKYIAIDKKTVNAANKAKATYETAIEASKSEVLLGDINKDGVVDIQDATMLQRYLAEYITSIDKTAADVNRDGKVNVRDLTQIQRYLAKYISSF